MTPAEPTLYDQIGGEPTFRRLVEAFYQRVENDANLRPMFPEDMTDGKRWQYLFLMQLWGGPSLYSDERGHPRLRMRHAPFPITPAASAAWVRCMLEAMEEVDIQEPMRQTMRDYFEKGAAFMVNRSSGGDE